MKPKNIIIELLIVLAIAIASSLIVQFAFSVFLGNLSLDIKFHDTYFTAPQSLFLVPFVFLAMLVYAVKEALYRYKRTFQNLILLTSIFLFNVQLLFYYKIAAKLSILPSGWTIYPPLSALPQHNLTSHPSPSPFRGILEILFYTQIFFAVLLVIIAVLTGKNWKTKNGTNKA